MKGMTGFSHISKLTDYGRVDVYVKSLNSRFLEVKILLPPILQSIEPFVRKLIRDNFKRGKVEIVVEFLPKGLSFEVFVDEELGKKYFLSLKRLSNALGLLPDIEIVDIASMPNVVNVVKSELPMSFIKELQNILKKAVNEVIKQRKVEGDKTKEDITKIIDGIKKSVLDLRNRWNEVNMEIENKVKERVEKFLKEYENRREVDTSIVAFLMKVDINEEIFRFSKHLEDLEKLLDMDGVGKRIEFILQELIREINTIASKSFDYVISSLVVDIKSSIESIREHIQNIE